jgi:hypothetical protein
MVKLCFEQMGRLSLNFKDVNEEEYEQQKRWS